MCDSVCLRVHVCVCVSECLCSKHITYIKDIVWVALIRHRTSLERVSLVIIAIVLQVQLKQAIKKDLVICVASIDTGQYSHHHAWLHTRTHCRDASIVNFKLILEKHESDTKYVVRDSNVDTGRRLS